MKTKKRWGRKGFALFLALLLALSPAAAFAEGTEGADESQPTQAVEATKAPEPEPTAEETQKTKPETTETKAPEKETEKTAEETKPEPAPSESASEAVKQPSASDKQEEPEQKAETCTITFKVNHPEAGTVKVDGNPVNTNTYKKDVEKDAAFRFTATAKDGWKTGSVKANGSDVEKTGSPDGYIIKDVAADTVVEIQYEKSETVKAEEETVPKAVQEFLDAVKALPSADEVTKDNAESVGEKVNAVLDLYEALDEELAEREDVAEALEKVYAVYEAVCEAEELEDSSGYVASEKGVATSADSRFYPTSGTYNLCDGNWAETGYGQIELANVGDIAVDDFFCHYYRSHSGTAYPLNYINLTVSSSNPNAVKTTVSQENGHIIVRFERTGSGTAKITVGYTCQNMKVTTGLAQDSDWYCAVSGQLIYTVTGGEGNTPTDPDTTKPTQKPNADNIDVYMFCDNYPYNSKHYGHAGSLSKHTDKWSLGEIVPCDWMQGYDWFCPLNMDMGAWTNFYNGFYGSHMFSLFGHGYSRTDAFDYNIPTSELGFYWNGKEWDFYEGNLFIVMTEHSSQIDYKVIHEYYSSDGNFEGKVEETKKNGSTGKKIYAKDLSKKTSYQDKEYEYKSATPDPLICSDDETYNVIKLRYERTVATAPEAPKREELHGILGDGFVQVHDQTERHGDKQYSTWDNDTAAGHYESSVGEVYSKDGDGAYYCDVTLYGDVYAAMYSCAESFGVEEKHTLVTSNETKTITLKYGEDGEWHSEKEKGTILATFYVKCEQKPVTYTVTYTDGVPGKTVFPDQGYEGLKAGEATPEFVGTPTRDGYTFKGWDPEVAKTVSGDVTYVAQWEKIVKPPVDQVTLTYDANGGQNPPAAQTVNKGEKVTVAGQGDMTWDGHTFLGWSTDQKAKEPDETWDPNSVKELEANTTLYAVWEEEASQPENASYIVRWFDKDTKEPIKADDTRTGTVGTTVSVTDADKTVEGYTYDAGNAGNITSKVLEADGTVLVLYFTKNESEQVTLTVKFVDKDGKPLKDDTITTANKGDDYNVSETTGKLPGTITIDGKTYKTEHQEGSDPVSGTADSDKIIVVVCTPENTGETNPSDETRPTGPTTPSQPTSPTVPTDPTTPSQPTDPTDPTDPTTPTEPSSPTDPQDPTEPTTPVIPVGPTTPTDPGTPSGPNTPNTPADPNGPAGTAGGTVTVANVPTVTPAAIPAVAALAPAAAPAAPAAAGTTIADDAVPLAAQTEAQQGLEQLADDGVPLAKGSGAWALLNFALMNLAIFECLMLLIGYFIKTKGAAEEEEEENKKLKKKGIMRIISLPIAAISLIAFCLTEDITLPTAIVDRYTLLMAIIALVQTVAVVLSRKELKDETDDETEERAVA